MRRQDDAQVDRDWPEEGISSVSSVRRTNASRRQEQLRVSSSEERQNLRQGGLAMGFVSGDRTRRRSCLLRDSTSTGGAEAPQQQSPPDTRTGQSAKACLRREVPTDHGARGQAQRRQLRRVATELLRDRDPEAEAKHAKHGRIRTQISYLSRMTSDRGRAEVNTWVSTSTGKKLVENKCSGEATPEGHGVPWWAAHGVP